MKSLFSVWIRINPTVPALLCPEILSSLESCWNMWCDDRMNIKGTKEYNLCGNQVIATLKITSYTWSDIGFSEVCDVNGYHTCT